MLKLASILCIGMAVLAGCTASSTSGRQISSSLERHPPSAESPAQPTPVPTATPSASATPVPGAYTAAYANNWQQYATTADLRAADLFWMDAAGNPQDYVDLVPDPLFGKVARITQGMTADSRWINPRMAINFNSPLAHMWLRVRVKYSPGFTTVGPLPSGHANSYKLLFWLWQGYEARGQIEFSNTSQYILGFGVRQPGGSYLQYNETPMPGSQSFGNVTTEWTDGEWWEYVIHYEKTGSSSARQAWYRRRLTQGGALQPQPFTFTGMSFSGDTTPVVRGIELGGNKNKNTPTTQYLYWGPWEAVDGAQYPNPFGL